MTRDPARRRGGDDRSAGGDGARNTTRRTFLAAAVAAGAGLGAVGIQLGEGDTDGRPPPGTDGGNVTRTTGAGSETDRDAEQSLAPAGAPVLGANLNGRPHRLLDNLELIDASNTSWVRAFLDVRRKLASGTDPRDDPDVRALRQVVRERGCRLVVSLKWDFKANWGDKPQMRVPSPGSEGERELFGCAQRYLEAIGEPVDVVVLGNEPIWETLDADAKVDDPPIVRFTRNAKDHLVRHGDHGTPRYLVGAFNRTHDVGVRERQYPQLHRGLFDVVREDEDVDGVDLHVHYDGFQQAERTVAFARSELPDATITVTEFSPVWRYYRYVGRPIVDFEAGERFAADHDLPTGTTAIDYFEFAKRNPRPPEELAEFYDAMPWYNANHVEDVYTLFADYDVEIGTMGFLQGLGMRNEDWTSGWLPFHINFLFQPALTRTEGGLERTAHRHYIEDYRERAVRAGARAR